MLNYPSMPIEKERVFDTKDIMTELNYVMQSGLNKIIERFIDKFNAYEETHNYIMSVPCVKKLITEKEIRLANTDLTEEFKISKIQELYKKVSELINENENLRKELNKYKSEENISLQIIEKEKPSIVENDEKMYEQILNPVENTSKKVLMNNMFKVIPDLIPSNSHEIEEEKDSDDEDKDSDDEDDEDEKHTTKVEIELVVLEESDLEYDEEKNKDTHEVDVTFKLLTKTEEEEDVETENEEEEEEDVFEIEIDDVTYFTNNEENGSIYIVDENGDPGKKIGYLKEGEPFFY